MRRILVAVAFALAELAWSGYSAVLWLGAAFPDYADDEVFNQIKRLEISAIEWRWLAVSLMLGFAYAICRSFFEDRNVQENPDC
jgi:hypothetical protein